MAIITHSGKQRVPQDTMLNIYPDQYVSQSEKESDEWWKGNLDYFYSVGINKYAHNKDFARNYEILKGKLRREDFYEEEVRSFTETMLKDDDLPKYVKHFSIMTPVISDLVGEMTKRPDNVYVKAFDDDSKAEENQFRSDILNDYIFQNARTRILTKLAEQGIEPESEEELTALTEEQLVDTLTTYTSQAERWGSRIMEYLKVRFSLKEKSEEAFRDLLIVAREYFLVYEDKSDIMFNVKTLNPKNVWHAMDWNGKYVSDPLDIYKGAYAAGTIEVMELSQILNEFDLTYEEVEHLRKQSQQNYLLTGTESNLVRPGREGIDSITYDTYNPLLLQERMLLEAELNGEGGDELSTFLLPGSEITTFGNKYIVLRAYWCSKKKVGKLKYIDAEGYEVETLVDENYKNKEHPGQIDLEWGWVNQWYEGYKIGPDVYYVKPFELLDYCPIIGSIFEGKNAEPQSAVDLMKPYQTLCNIFMNKMYESIQKDMGPVLLTSIRSLPIPKEGDAKDAIEIWMAEARERGIIFTDDSPENLAAAASFNQHKVHDMSRVNEMQGFISLYLQIKNEAHELLGITRQRLGSTQATETATATNTAITQSYAQTEPWFIHHEYTLNKLYQAIMDAAIYTQSRKPESTLSYISNEGEQAFIKINGSDLKLRNLGVLVTSRSDDAQTFRDLKMLTQAMLQNGASPYEIVSIYTTKSLRQVKDTMKRLKEQQDQMIAQQQQLEQQKLEQQQAQFEQQAQLAMLEKEKDVQNDNMNKALDRESKERIAIIQASGFGEVQPEDADGDGVFDVLELQKITDAQSKAKNDYDLKLRELDQKQQDVINGNITESRKLDLEREKLQVEREKMKSQERIAVVNRNKHDSKSKTKK